MGHVFELEAGRMYCGNGNMQQPSLDGNFLTQQEDSAEIPNIEILGRCDLLL